MLEKINVVDDKERYRIGNKITWITIVINIILAIGKIMVGIISNSTAMLADGIHTISDIASSIGIVVGFFIANKPEDIEHQYGHEKAESIAGFVLSLLLISVGFKIGYSAVMVLIDGSSQVPGSMAVWAAVVSIVVKELQYRLALYGGRKINSSALIADAWHHRSDALSSIAALVGIVGARMGYEFLDPLAGLAVSVIVVKVGVQLFIQGYNELMDTSIDEKELSKLEIRLMKESQINNIRELRARKHGSKVFVDVKACVNSDISVLKGHNIAEKIEKIVQENISNTKDVLVHIDPCEMGDGSSSHFGTGDGSSSHFCRNCNKNGS